MTDSQQIGYRIRARREHLDKTQQDIADSLSITRANYSKYESGRVTVSAPDLQRIARLLGVRASFLLGEEEAKSQEEIVYEPIMDELRAASYSGVLDDDLADEIAEDIRNKARRRARKRGAA